MFRDNAPAVPDGPYIPFGVITDHALAWETYRYGDIVERPLAGLGHGLICGATGSGKTVTMYPLIWHAMREGGFGCVMIDFKASTTTRAAIAAAAAETEKPCMHLTVGGNTPTNPPFYDPLAWDGTPEQKASMLLSCFNLPTDGAAAYYTAMAQTWLRLTITLMAYQPPNPGESSLAYLIRMCEKAQVTAAIKQVAKTNPDAAAHLTSMVGTTIQDKDLAGLRGHLTNIALPLAPYLAPPTPGDGRMTLDLGALADAGACLYVSISAADETVVKGIGTLICQHLTSIMQVRMRSQHGAPMLVCIDEASALGEKATVVETLLKQAREANMWVWLATQQLAAWPESVQTAILGNTSTLIVLRADDAPSAETLSQALGTGISIEERREEQASLTLAGEKQKLGAGRNRTLQTGPLVEPSELQAIPSQHAYICFRTIPGIDLGHGQGRRRVPATPRAWRTNPRLKKGWEVNFTYDLPMVRIIAPTQMLQPDQAVLNSIADTPAASGGWDPTMALLGNPNPSALNLHTGAGIPMPQAATPTAVTGWDGDGDDDDDAAPAPYNTRPHNPQQAPKGTPAVVTGWDEDEDEPAQITPTAPQHPSVVQPVVQPAVVEPVQVTPAQVEALPAPAVAPVSTTQPPAQAGEPEVVQPTGGDSDGPVGGFSDL